MTVTIREPAVAGQFYSGTRESLLKELRSISVDTMDKERAIGVVSPHAGYVYSGAVAANVFDSIKPSTSYVIMGPNHTGFGAAFGISTVDSWRTPLGDAAIDRKLARAIKTGCNLIKDDDLSHAHEHSIEVQIPFLQFKQEDLKFVPITVSHADIAVYRDVGRAIARAIKGLSPEKSVTIVASSDMTHYESQETAKRKDEAAIKAMLGLDEEMLMDAVSRMGISMCGYGPCAIMIAAAKELGADKARLVRYQTSGDVSGDYSSVVGYAGIVVN